MNTAPVFASTPAFVYPFTGRKPTKLSVDPLDIRKVINLDKLQQLQDDNADVTGLAVLTSNYKGVPVTRHSRRCEFCGVMRSIPEYRELCEKCDYRGGKAETTVYLSLSYGPCRFCRTHHYRE